MKKLRLKDGSLLFLPNTCEVDCDAYLLGVIRDLVGDDLASELEEMLARDAAAHSDAMAELEAAAAKANERLRTVVAERDNAIALLDAERTAHITEIGELEDELVRLNDLKDLLWSTNGQLTEILKNLGWSGFADTETADTGLCVTEEAEDEEPLPRVCFNCAHSKMVDGSFDGGIMLCRVKGSYHYLEQEGCDDFAPKEG